MATLAIQKVISTYDDTLDKPFVTTLFCKDVDGEDKFVIELHYADVDGMVVEFYASPAGATHELDGIPE